MELLEAWQTYYIIVGPSAGALIGLQFIVITLVTQRPPPRAGEANSSFATPTIVHFAATLSLSAMLCAPWPTLPPVQSLWSLLGVGGVGYMVLVTRRMRRQRAYVPGPEDWLFHAWLPFVAYGSLLLAGFWALVHPSQALYVVGVATLLLLLVGIHNAWDAVVYLATRQTEQPDSPR
jgi:hypothetical protein